MGLDNYINNAMRSILKNPILEVLTEINITKILRQSNFIKRVVVHLVKMLITDSLKIVAITGESFYY